MTNLMDINITASNQTAVLKMFEAEPVLEDIQPAINVVPNYHSNLILTSGPTMEWKKYIGGQKAAILGACRFEGLAVSDEDAERKINAGEIEVRGAQDFGCIGSLAGVYSASMPVLIVKNRTLGNKAFCNFYEGTNPRRLNYGIYDAEVKRRLQQVSDVVAPTLAEAIRVSGGVSLKPIMKRALNMGDELHSRNTAAALLFMKEIIPHLLTVAATKPSEVRETIDALTADHYFFLRFSMAAAKATADAGHGVKGSSLVTAMCFNCREFSIRVSGLGDNWFSGEHPEVDAKLFEGFTKDDISWMGGESPITETIGLGGFAQACAPSLQAYQGGTVEALVRKNIQMYDITVGENPDYKIAYLGYRGVPTGIDVFKVLEKKTGPVMDIGIAGRNGGQIGAGTVSGKMGCFERAAERWEYIYG